MATGHGTIDWNGNNNSTKPVSIGTTKIDGYFKSKEPIVMISVVGIHIQASNPADPFDFDIQAKIVEYKQDHVIVEAYASVVVNNIIRRMKISVFVSD